MYFLHFIAGIFNLSLCLSPSLSQTIMRSLCKQLISSLFAHMCLTPHIPQWVLGFVQ